MLHFRIVVWIVMIAGLICADNENIPGSVLTIPNLGAVLKPQEPIQVLEGTGQVSIKVLPFSELSFTSMDIYDFLNSCKNGLLNASSIVKGIQNDSISLNKASARQRSHIRELSSSILVVNDLYIRTIHQLQNKYHSIRSTSCYLWGLVRVNMCPFPGSSVSSVYSYQSNSKGLTKTRRDTQHIYHDGSVAHHNYYGTGQDPDRAKYSRSNLDSHMQSNPPSSPKIPLAPIGPPQSPGYNSELITGRSYHHPQTRMQATTEPTVVNSLQDRAEDMRSQAMKKKTIDQSIHQLSLADQAQQDPIDLSTVSSFLLVIQNQARYGPIVAVNTSECYIYQTGFTACMHDLKKIRHTRETHDDDFSSETIPTLDMQLDEDNTKSSLLPIIGDAWSMLFGTATNRDVEKQRKITELMKTAIRSNSKQLVNVGHQIIYLSEKLKQEKNRTSTLINKAITLMNHNMQTTTDALSNYVVRLKANEESQDVINTLNLIYVQQNTIMEQLTGLAAEFVSLNQDLRAVAAMIRGEYVDYSIIPIGQLDQIRIDFQNSLPQYQTTLTLSELIYFSEPKSVEYSTASDTLILSMKWPVLKRMTSINVYHIHTLPYLKNNGYYRILNNPEILVVDTYSKAWLRMTIGEYTNCKSSKFKTCVPVSPWNKLPEYDCFAYFWHKGVIKEELCYIEHMTQAPTLTDLHVPLGSCSWLVSSYKSDTKLVKTCMSPGSMDTVTQVPLKGMVQIDVPAGCVYTIDGYMYTCRSYDFVSSDSLSSAISLAFKQLTTVSIQSDTRYYDAYLPSLNLTFDTVSIDKFKEDVLFSTDSLSLSVFQQKVSNGTVKFASEQQKLMARINRVQGLVGDSESSFSSFSWLYHVVSPTIGIALLVCIGAGIWYACKRNPIIATAAAVPLKGSFAASINTTAISAVVKTGQKFTNESSIFDPFHLGFSNINLTTQALGEVLSNMTHLHAGMSTFYFITIMTFHLITGWMMYRMIRKLVIRWALRSGAKTLNKKALHHAGEVRLCATILCDFFPWFVGHKVTREIDCQICTLPGNYASWYCIVDDTLSDWLVPTVNHVWSKNIWIKCKWGSFCLKNSDYPEMDTCEELPKKIVLAATHVNAQIDKYQFIPWRIMRPCSLTTLYLSGPTFHKTLWQYMDNPHSNKPKLTNMSIF